MGWVGLIQIAEVGGCSVEAHFVPVSGVQNTGAGRQEKEGGTLGCWHHTHLCPLS